MILVDRMWKKLPPVQPAVDKIDATTIASPVRILSLSLPNAGFNFGTRPNFGYHLTLLDDLWPCTPTAAAQFLQRPCDFRFPSAISRRSRLPGFPSRSYRGSSQEVFTARRELLTGGGFSGGTGMV